MVGSVNYSMKEVRVIRPYRAVKEICCCECDLSYSKAHYKTLFEAKKLAYFGVDSGSSAPDKVICHQCFFGFLVKSSSSHKGSPFTIKFIDGKKKQIMEVTADLSNFDISGNGR